MIGSIVEYLFAPDDPEAVIEKLADPGDPDRLADRHRGRLQLRRGHRRVRRRRPGACVADLAAGRGAARRRSGWSPRRWRRRRERGIAPFTVMSCDNIQGNGDVARRSVHRVRPRCATPSWRRGSRREVRVPQLDGRPDHARSPPTRTAPRSPSGSASTTRWPVVCEPFTQWVLEDALRRRPAAARGRRRAGRRRRRAVRADEAAAAQRQPPGAVLLRATWPATGSCTRSPRTRCSRRSCCGYMDEEATPTLAPVPGVDLDRYKRDLIERFSNPACATPSRGCAPRAPTASRSGCCR